MKNLNKKISVLALSGMVVFGGVAGIEVQSFASSEAASLQQKIGHFNPVIDEINETLEKLAKDGKKYTVLEAYSSRERVEKELKEGTVSKIRSLSTYVPVVKEGKLTNILGRFLGKFDVFAVHYKGLSYIIIAEELAEQFGASKVQSLETSESESLQQKTEHFNPVIDEINETLEKLAKDGKKYTVLESYSSRERVEKELKEGTVSKIRSLSTYVPIVKEGKLTNILGRFLGKFDAFAVHYKGLSYIIIVENLEKQFAE